MDISEAGFFIFARLYCGHGFLNNNNPNYSSAWNPRDLYQSLFPTFGGFFPIINGLQ